MEKQIISKLLDLYSVNKRDLPWRFIQKNNLPNPYYVFVSEYMLQQTTVPTVKTRFEEFIKRWPTLKDLAKITEPTILKFWSGLGYYSRARNLLKAAKIIDKKLSGLNWISPIFKKLSILRSSSIKFIIKVVLPVPGPP